MTTSPYGSSSWMAKQASYGSQINQTQQQFLLAAQKQYASVVASQQRRQYEQMGYPTARFQVGQWRLFPASLIHKLKTQPAHILSSDIDSDLRMIARFMEPHRCEVEIKLHYDFADHRNMFAFRAFCSMCEQHYAKNVVVSDISRQYMQSIQAQVSGQLESWTESIASSPCMGTPVIALYAERLTHVVASLGPLATHELLLAYDLCYPYSRFGDEQRDGRLEGDLVRMCKKLGFFNEGLVRLPPAHPLAKR